MQTTTTKEAGVHPYFLYELQRHNLAETERKVALQRMFNEDRESPRRERGPLIGRVLAALRRESDRAERPSLRTDAYACR